MGIVIAIAGLGTIGAGVYLAWHQRGAGTWATLGVGLALVLVGGPLGSQLASFSLTGTGLNVTLLPQALDAAEASSVEEVAERSILEIASAASVQTANPDEAALLGEVAVSFQSQLFAFIKSLGFVPAQIAGASRLAPGSVVRIVDGRPVLWATPEEAFSALDTLGSSVAVPDLAQDVVDSIGGQRFFVNFVCDEGGRLVEASYSALAHSARRVLLRDLSRDPDLRVVQATIVCSGFELDTGREGAGDIPDREQARYLASDPVVLGYRLAELKLEGA